MDDQDVIGFGVVDVECERCSASGELFRLIREPFGGDGGDWPEVMVVCERCLREIKTAIERHMETVAFRRGESHA